MDHRPRPAPDLTWHRVEDVVRMPGPRVLVHEAQSKSHQEAGRPCKHHVNARVSGHCDVKAKKKLQMPTFVLAFIPGIFQYIITQSLAQRWCRVLLLLQQPRSVEYTDGGLLQRIY